MTELIGSILMLIPVTLMTVVAYERCGIYSGIAALVYGMIGTLLVSAGVVMAYGVN